MIPNWRINVTVHEGPTADVISVAAGCNLCDYECCVQEEVQHYKSGMAALRAASARCRTGAVNAIAKHAHARHLRPVPLDGSVEHR